MKTCTRCGITKVFGAFRYVRGRGEHPWCRMCESEAGSARAKKKPAVRSCCVCRGDHERAESTKVQPPEGGTLWICGSCWARMAGPVLLEEAR